MVPEVEEVVVAGCRSHYCIDQVLDRVEGEVAGCIYDIHIRRKG